MAPREAKRAQGPLRISALNSLLGNFISALAAAGWPAQRAILYGSYAKGHPKPESDVDVAVWLRRPMPEMYTQVPAVLRAVSAHHPISPKFYDPGDVAEDNPFIEEIEQTGKEMSLTEDGLLAANLRW